MINAAAGVQLVLPANRLGQEQKRRKKSGNGGTLISSSSSVCVGKPELMVGVVDG